MRKYNRSLVGVVVMVGSALAATADATPAADPIVVVEARVGAPPTAPDEIGTAMQAAFSAAGFAATPAEIAHVLGGRMPRPGLVDRDVSAAALVQPLQDGYLAWSQAQWRDAEKALSAGFALVYRNPALLATDTKYLDTIFRGMAALALSQQKLGEKDKDKAKAKAEFDASHETMLDLLRAFRTHPLPREEYAPEAIDYWRKVAKEADAMGHGQLFASVDNDHVMILIDGQMHGVGSASLAEMLPGRHRIFMQVPSRSDPGRQYETVIRANEDATLKVRWEVDSAFWATAAWTGFSFATEAEHANEASYAGELASWSGRGVAVVIDRGEVDGHAAVIGSLYGVGGARIRRGMVAIDGDRSSALRTLATYLADGTPGPGLQVSPDHGSPPVPGARQEPGMARAATPSSTAAKVVIGAGLAMIVASTGVYVTNYDDGSQPEFRDWQTPAVVAFSAGSVALGTGAYLWLRDSRRMARGPAAALGGGLGAITAGAMLFVTAQPQYRPGWQRPTYRATAVPGAVVGALGVVATGVGAWWLHSHGGDHGPTPTVSVQRGAASVGVAIGF